MKMNTNFDSQNLTTKQSMKSDRFNHPYFYITLFLGILRTILSYFEHVAFYFFVSKAIRTNNYWFTLIFILIGLTIKISKIYTQNLSRMYKYPIYFFINLINMLAALIFMIDNLLFYKKTLNLIFSEKTSSIFKLTDNNFRVFIYMIILYALAWLIIFINLPKILKYIKLKRSLIKLWLWTMIIIELTCCIFTNFFQSDAFYLVMVISLYVLFKTKEYYKNLVYKKTTSFYQNLCNFFKLVFVLFVLYRINFEKNWVFS
ncbi:hypothetical protein TUBRATIS_007460 [Tubulinosema ratisbonensis]|uniref:Uncharacterized protein n=1 Tax=Tubulinosema ratisbonensis TaxID=291195 RepID=A0A437ANS1_9MICR|nr:hypothetical protein TUBRATIS_007460 [Tubulinosema ratisbonensis]